MEPLTIITDPVPVGKYFFSERLKAAARKIKRIFKPLPSWMSSSYRGHPAVTRSLVEGLKKIGAPYIYNPRSISEIIQNVIVLSNPDALKQAIGFKKRGYIKKLLAGPNMFSFPSEFPDVLTNEVDLYIAPCPWITEHHQRDCPQLKGRCISWPAGVDTAYWMPSQNNRNSKSVLVFEKKAFGEIPSIKPYVKILSRRGYKVFVFKRNKNASYLPADYRDFLNECALMVGFSATESQGITWVEAWSMTVPTLVWHNSRTTLFVKGKRIEDTNTAPYLMEPNGAFFKNPEDFELLLKKWESHTLHFSPRDWVLNNMSDEVCARKLLEIMERV